MGSYQYNAAAFAQAISNATRLVSEASAAQSSINSALDSLNPPEDLDIRGMISTIKAKVNEFVQKAKEIRSQVESIRSQIESTDAALASQVNSLVERNGIDTIKAASDLPFKERLKNLIKGAGATISATAKTALESIGAGMLKTGAKVVSGVVSNVAEAIDKVNFDILKNDTFMGKTRKEYYNDVEKNLKNIKYFTETPEYTYTDGAGVERYKSLYSHGNNSAIDLDGKTANTITSFSEMLSDIALVSTGAGGVALSAFGRGGEGVNQALDEGYHVDSSLLNYGTLKTGAGVVEAAIDKYVIGNIPEVKGLGGKLQNIAIGGLSNAPEVFVNTMLQGITYKSDEDFINIFQDNGGLKQAGIDALTGDIPIAGGEIISGIAGSYLKSKVTKDIIKNNIDPLFGYGKEGNVHTSDISNYIYNVLDGNIDPKNTIIDIKTRRDMSSNINANNGIYTPTSDDIVNMFKRKIESDVKYTLSHDFDNITQYKDAKFMFDGMNINQYLTNTKNKLLLNLNNRNIGAESIYDQKVIIDTFYEDIANVSDYLNQFDKDHKFNSNKVDLTSNTLVLTDKQYNISKPNKDFIAYNTSISDQKTINVLDDKMFRVHDLIHEATHDGSNYYNGTGFKMWNVKDKEYKYTGINEGATEFIALRKSGGINNGGYDRIVDVYTSLNDALNSKGINGFDEIGSAYYNHNIYDLHGLFTSVFSDENKANKLWGDFIDAADDIAKGGNSTAKGMLAEGTLQKIANEITLESAKK